MLAEASKPRERQVSGFRLQTSGFRLQASDFRLQTSGFRKKGKPHGAFSSRNLKPEA
jgi:hypothetical protein